MSDIVRVKYSRVFSLGNFENERIHLEADLGDDDDPRDVVRQLAVMANNYHQDLVSWREELHELHGTVEELKFRRQTILAQMYRTHDALKNAILNGERIDGVEVSSTPHHPGYVDNTGEYVDDQDDDDNFSPYTDEEHSF